MGQSIKGGFEQEDMPLVLGLCQTIHDILAGKPSVRCANCEMREEGEAICNCGLWDGQVEPDDNDIDDSEGDSDDGGIMIDREAQ